MSSFIKDKDVWLWYKVYKTAKISSNQFAYPWTKINRKAFVFIALNKMLFSIQKY